jgi:hypothetical protein
MYCVSCNQAIEEKARFCPFCGQAQPAPKEIIAPIVADAAPTAVTPIMPFEEETVEVAPAFARPDPATARKSPNPKRRRYLIGCASGLLALILLCTGSLIAVYFWLGLNRNHQIAQIVPAETTAYISINPTIWQLSRLRHYDNLTSGAAIFAAIPGIIEIGQALQGLPINLTLNPQQDIIPWIGNEISLAIIADSAAAPGRGGGTPLPAQAAHTGPTFVLAAVSRDTVASNALLAKIQQQLEQEDVRFDMTNHRGIPVTEIISLPATPLAWATVNNLIIIASDSFTLEKAVDAALDGSTATLGAQPSFQQAIANVSRSRLGYIVINGDSLREQINWQTEFWQGIETIALTISLENEGMRLDYALQYDANVLSPLQMDFLENPPQANNLAASAPANTALYVSSHNMPLLWEAVLNSDLRDMGRRLREETRIRLEDDLLELASGQYAVALTADRGGLPRQRNTPYGGIILVETADRRMVERQLNDAAQRFGDRYFFPVYSDEINRTPIQIMDFRNGDMIGFGFSGDTLFIGSSEDALRLAVRASSSSLAGVPLYQTAIHPLPQTSHIYLYADVQSLIRTNYDTWSVTRQDQFDDQFRSYLRNIRAISATAGSMNRQGLIQGVIFIVTN